MMEEMLEANKSVSGLYCPGFKGLNKPVLFCLIQQPVRDPAPRSAYGGALHQSLLDGLRGMEQVSNSVRLRVGFSDVGSV